ncbi:hypothetical protein QBC45DRAFT_436147 [Copromyces sp. CBS 386.78]|nr:hypothetical protein QBC45DRAFT_436147 [Copromyces sp. CBS 386.78]
MERLEAGLSGAKPFGWRQDRGHHTGLVPAVDFQHAGTPSSAETQGSAFRRWSGPRLSFCSSSTSSQHQPQEEHKRSARSGTEVFFRRTRLIHLPNIVWLRIPVVGGVSATSFMVVSQNIDYDFWKG